MSKHRPLQTQFIIFVLFGDVVTPHGGQIWASSLLSLLKLLGVSERAARSTLSRMVRKGWLKTKREGRHSLYALTPKGRRLLTEGGQRIFEPRKRDWDGRWHLVVYSLPESKRRLRDDLRKRLTWLGFGRAAPGSWISAHDRQTELEDLLADLNVHDYVHYFSDVRLAIGSDQEIVEECWDLKNLNRRYARFIAKWEPEYEKLSKGECLSPAQCFVQRFWITNEHSQFPRLDPNLPDALLPDDWLGDKAACIFDEYRNLLSERANEFLTTTLNVVNGRNS